ncbi:MAG TPA: NDP-sugar synthase [Solirubrobacterales bacterium]|nr:NDP-sugar synthase [Solirubrobacterales bacterium]
MRAMILAAGLGTRLRPLTYVMPKPVAPVLNRPIVSWIAELLAGHGFPEVVANVSYLPEQIRGVLGDGSEFGLEISYSEEPEPLGTAGGVGKVRDFLSGTDSFLIISGDALTHIDLGEMRAAHEANVERGAIATLATKRVADTTQFGVAITDEDGRIQGFQEKPEPAEALSDLANCGIYMFRKEIFDHFPPPDHRSPAGDPDQPPGFVDWALDVFPSLLDGDIPFYSHEIHDYWNDIGSVGEFVQGNLDALAGVVGIEPREPLVADGVYSGDGSEIDAAKVKAPILLGADCLVGAGTDLHGPLVVGPGSRLGADAMLRDCVVLPGAEVPAGALVVGGLYGINPDRPLG